MNSSYITTINLTFNIQSIKEMDSIEIDIKGILVSYKNKTFIISTHLCYPIESIKINDKIYK